ncbi:hypothetical protein [Serratia ureilytica]|uniref:hypothetical protein n=1 Tax=Serratia ureilytica TaxID=300181 RepID=UPI0018E866D8|nr:hypothetical protein [Serratia ureilytica]MBJ2080589.1 hypothetical protein [Serratia ureilytica]
MTVSTEVSREEYTGNGVTTDFDYRFRVFSADELVVTVADTTENIRTLVMNTDYTVTGAGSRNGGKVKLVSALASNWRISIERELPVTQETDIRNQGNFFPEVHEDAWDKLTMLIQQAIGGLGLALRKPNWLAKYYDAKGNRIANMADPTGPQDAATKKYVDETEQNNLRRVLRFPENVAAMPDAETRGHSLQGYTAEGRPTPVFSMTDTADLALKLASEGGAGLVGFDIEKTYPIATIGHQFTNIFRNAQHLEFYYDKLGDWDEAYFQAQMNVFRLGFSPEVLLPGGVVDIYRPFFGGPAIGDLIHARHPELGLYNGDGTYKGTWPLILKGVYKKNEDGLTNPYTGTQIVFHGCADQNDNTWRDFGVIHSAPTNLSERRVPVPVKQWFGTVKIDDLNIRVLNRDNSRHGKCHGIYSFYGPKSEVNKIVVYQPYGGGIICDLMWDSVLRDCVLLQCGRMSPNIGDYQSAKNVDIKYQTYAPLHILYSATGSDNSNFIRFENFHFEDNYHSVADVIVSGDSSPIHIINSHHETDRAAGVPAVVNGGFKKRLAAGTVGVRYMGQDSEPGFDYTAGPFTARGGYLHADGANGYQLGYDDVYYGGRYTGAILENIKFPNSGGIKVAAGNTACTVVASNSTFTDISFSGGNESFAPLKMSNCNIKSLTMSYAYGFKLSNVEVESSITLSNMYTNANGICGFSNVSAASFNGVISYGTGDLTLTSPSVKSEVVCYFGNVTIPRYSYYNNVILGGAP